MNTTAREPLPTPSSRSPPPAPCARQGRSRRRKASGSTSTPDENFPGLHGPALKCWRGAFSRNGSWSMISDPRTPVGSRSPVQVGDVGVELPTARGGRRTLADQARPHHRPRRGRRSTPGGPPRQSSGSVSVSTSSGAAAVQQAGRRRTPGWASGGDRWQASRTAPPAGQPPTSPSKPSRRTASKSMPGAHFTTVARSRYRRPRPAGQIGGRVEASAAAGASRQGQHDDSVPADGVQGIGPAQRDIPLPSCAAPSQPDVVDVAAGQGGGAPPGQ